MHEELKVPPLNWHNDEPDKLSPFSRSHAPAWERMWNRILVLPQHEQLLRRWVLGGVLRMVSQVCVPTQEHGNEGTTPAAPLLQAYQGGFFFPFRKNSNLNADSLRWFSSPKPRFVLPPMGEKLSLYPIHRLENRQAASTGMGGFS